MTSNNNANSTPPPRPSALRRTVVAASLIAGGFVVGVGSFAVASPGGKAWAGGWHGGHHGPHIGMIQHVVRGGLDNVGATTAQEDKIHDIIAERHGGSVSCRGAPAGGSAFVVHLAADQPGDW